LTDRDLVVNAGERVFRPRGAALEQGEYGTVKDGTVTKMQGRLGMAPKAQPTHGAVSLPPDQRAVADSKKPSGAPGTGEITVQEAYSAMRRRDFKRHLGKQVSWTVVPNDVTGFYLYTRKGSEQKDEKYGGGTWVALDGYMLVVPSEEGKTFALLVKIDGTEISKADAQIRKTLPTRNKGTVVYGTVGGVYENEKIPGSTAMPFLKDWHLEGTAPGRSDMADIPRPQQRPMAGEHASNSTQEADNRFPIRRTNADGIALRPPV
jgi:hypothetical protein